MREVKWWNLAPTSWHKFVSWGLGGFSHQISERSYHTHDLELIRKKEESNGQGPRLPRSRPPSSKLYVQEDFIHWLETSMYKWLFPRIRRMLWTVGNVRQDSRGLAEESGLYRDKRQNLGTWVQRCGSKRKGTLQVVPHLKWLTCGFPSPHFLWLENDVPCRAITALPCIWPRCWGSLVLCLRTKEVPPRIPATLGSGSFRLVCNKAVKNLGKQQAPALTHTMCIFYTYTHIYLQILHMYIHIYTHNIYTHVTHT